MKLIVPGKAVLHFLPSPQRPAMGTHREHRPVQSQLITTSKFKLDDRNFMVSFYERRFGEAEITRSELLLS